MDLFDRLTLDAPPRRTADGYMVASVRAARSGVQQYSGKEVGRPDLATVRVYRPEDEVFKADSLASYAHRPVTVEHPDQPVTAETWREVSVGMTGDRVVRDGNFVRVDMAIMDAEAITAIEAGKREISQGYSCDLTFQDGTTPDGLPYDAIQNNIRANHTAIVGFARGGHDLKIGDSDMADRQVTIDGHQVTVSDAAAILIDNLTKRATDAELKASQLSTQVGTLTAQVATKDGETVALKQQLADATMTPAKIDAAVAARATVLADAHKILPTLDATGKTDAEIRRMAVASKLGDKAATMDDATISGAFAAFAIAAPTTDADPTARALGTIPQVTDAAAAAMDKAWQAGTVDPFNSWRNKPQH